MAFINMTIAAAVIKPTVSLAFGDETTATKTINDTEYTVNLTATSPDTIDTYKWQKKTGTGTWQNLTSTVINTKEDVVNTTGIYSYRCTVIREDGVESEYSNEITVDFTAQAAQAPTADIYNVNDTDDDNNISVTEGSDVILSASESAAYDGATITNYMWEIVTRPSGDTATSTVNGDSFTLNNTVVGGYTIKVTVTDSNGLTDSENFDIIVEAVGDPINPSYKTNNPDTVLKKIVVSGEVGTFEDMEAHKEDDTGTENYSIQVIHLSNWPDGIKEAWAYVPHTGFTNPNVQFTAYVDGVAQTVVRTFTNEENETVYINL